MAKKASGSAEASNVPVVRVGTTWKSRDKREHRWVTVVSVSMSGDKLDAKNTKTGRVTHMTTRVFVKTFKEES